MSRLAKALFSTTQQKILGLLYGHPAKSFYMKEILRKTGMGVATIKRELDRMVEAEIIKMHRIGNQHHYQANPECPIYEQLVAIVNKTFGARDLINTVLTPLQDKITWAFIFGSVASAKESASSDIDLMIIGDVDYTEVVKLIYTVQETLGREINPKIFTTEEWNQKLSSKDAFIDEVLKKPRIDVIGDGHEFR